ncbi:MAG TPA: SDR family NAD(P)-dependent oxidoreductase, partial [Polyangia bacterium]
AAVAVATSAFGRLDVVVNNAGYIKANSVEDLPEDDFRRQIEINLFGVYNVTRAALPVMHAQRDGHIIQISSIGGRRGTPGLSGYQSAKWAVGGFSEVLAREVAPLGIRVTCVEPGGMRTEMFGLSMLAEPLAPDRLRTDGRRRHPRHFRSRRGRPQRSGQGGAGDPAPGRREATAGAFAARQRRRLRRRRNHHRAQRGGRPLADAQPVDGPRRADERMSEAAISAPSARSRWT